jgi:hypothetical protein
MYIKIHLASLSVTQNFHIDFFPGGSIRPLFFLESIVSMAIHRIPIFNNTKITVKHDVFAGKQADI